MTAPLVMLIALAASAATLMGGLLALSLKEKLPLVLAFSAGAVIGVAFFDLGPEALELGAGLYAPATLLAISAGGFFLYALLDRLLGHHDHGAALPNPRRGVIGAISFFVHSMTDGFIMGIAFQASHEVGFVVAAAVLAHDFADGLNTVNVVVRHGGSRRFAMRWLALDAAAPLLGAGLSLMVTPQPGLLALLLALFCGFFLHIGASGLLPESYRARPQWSTLAATIAGAVFLHLVTLLAHAH